MNRSLFFRVLEQLTGEVIDTHAAAWAARGREEADGELIQYCAMNSLAREATENGPEKEHFTLAFRELALSGACLFLDLERANIEQVIAVKINLPDDNQALN